MHPVRRQGKQLSAEPGRHQIQRHQQETRRRDCGDGLHAQNTRRDEAVSLRERPMSGCSRHRPRPEGREYSQDPGSALANPTRGLRHGFVKQYRTCARCSGHCQCPEHRSGRGIGRERHTRQQNGNVANICPEHIFRPATGEQRHAEVFPHECRGGREGRAEDKQALHAAKHL